MQRCTALSVRSAHLSDARTIFHLIESLSADGTLLYRPLHEIEAHIDTFVVAETASGGFLGCAALHRYGPHLAEVRSIATLPEARGLGAGAMLVHRLLEEIHSSGTTCACLVTRIPGFFARYGFHTVSLASMREKVAKDCAHCPRREHCDEIAMVAGEMPPYWETPHNGLVQLA
jgi:amino-acid N-acetyltransferase